MLIDKNHYGYQQGVYIEKWDEFELKDQFWQISDNSELAKKIKKYSSYLITPLLDEHNNLIDFEIDLERYEKDSIASNAFREIDILKEKLANEDYKIIKCFEAFMNNKPLPYDINQLAEDRNTKRDAINELEKLLGDNYNVR